MYSITALTKRDAFCFVLMHCVHYNSTSHFVLKYSIGGAHCSLHGYICSQQTIFKGTHPCFIAAFPNCTVKCAEFTWMAFREFSGASSPLDKFGILFCSAELFWFKTGGGSNLSRIWGISAKLQCLSYLCASLCFTFTLPKWPNLIKNSFTQGIGGDIWQGTPWLCIYCICLY